MIDYYALAPVLQTIGLAEAAGEIFDAEAFDRAAEERAIEPGPFRVLCRFAHDTGLVHVPVERSPCSPSLLLAGRQYLARHGEVDTATLTFLPFTIDDLSARSALLRGGTLLIDEFRHALLAGRSVEHAASLVPPGFALAVTPRIALDLYAAAVALMVRLEAEDPPACLAEELLGLRLISYAESWLAVDVEEGALTRDEATCARAELPALFGLFRGTEALGLGEMKEPADAALLRDPRAASEPEFVDQRIEAWFKPFAGALPAGYLLAEPL